jgi:predicted ArsR family transcriptional regulator
MRPDEYKRAVIRALALDSGGKSFGYIRNRVFAGSTTIRKYLNQLIDAGIVRKYWAAGALFYDLDI